MEKGEAVVELGEMVDSVELPLALACLGSHPILYFLYI